MNAKTKDFRLVSGALRERAAITVEERPVLTPAGRSSCPHAGYADGQLIHAREVGQLVAVKACHDCGAIVEVLHAWDYELPMLTSPIPPERMAA